MKLLENLSLPTPAWIGLAIATVRTLMDWRRDVPFATNLRRAVLVYAVSVGASFLSFMAVTSPGTLPTARDTAICSVITFLSINIVNSLKTLGEDFERRPTRFLLTLLRAWRGQPDTPPDKGDPK